MSVTTTFSKDSRGRIDNVKLARQGKGAVEVQYIYVGDSISIGIKGDKRLLPSYAELIAMVDAKFLELIAPKRAGQVAEGEAIPVPNNTTTTICTAYGAGSVSLIHIVFATAAAPSTVGVFFSASLFVDGELVRNRAYYTNNWDLTQSQIGDFGRNCIGEFYQAGTPIAMIMNFRPSVEFKNRVTLRVLQVTGAPILVDGYIYANMS